MSTKQRKGRPFQPRDPHGSQLARLAAHFAAGESISPEEARAVYGIQRLAARVNDLRALGASVDATRKVDREGHRYTRYSPAPSARADRAMSTVASTLISSYGVAPRAVVSGSEGGR